MQKNKAGCLLIHGFGGGTYEIQNLASRLEELGYMVACPVLAGHEGGRRTLGASDYRQWIESAEKTLLPLAEECDSVHVIGFSMGGLIGANLAIKYEVDSMTTINTPIYCWDMDRIARNIILDIRKGEYSNIKRYARSSGKFPVSALLNFKLMLRKTKSRISEVGCPFLVVQALDDDTVRRTSAGYIYGRILSSIKRLEYISGGGHEILNSGYSHEVGRLVEDFIKQIECE